MSKSDKYAVKMETQLKAWDKAVDTLAASTSKHSGEALASFQETLRGLRSERDSAHDTFNRMRTSTEEAGRQLQSKMRVAWHTMESALQKATTDFRK